MHFEIDDTATVHVIPCLRDNYAYLLENRVSRDLVLIDAPEAAPILSALSTLGGLPHLRAIWSTHHHHDHVGGNLALGEAFRLSGHARHALPIQGHAHDRDRIPGLTMSLEDRDEWFLDDLKIEALHVPGHTLGALAYFVETPSSRLLFTGDTLFLGGCGRIFEGTPEMMWRSLSRLASLPPDTRIFCGHEYTRQNLLFAATLEPRNEAITRRLASLPAMTMGSPLALELETNPFLRPHSPELRQALGLMTASDVEVFAATRRAKDIFRA